MAELPRIKPPCLRHDAEQVLRRLREAGHAAYFAGGCVRDLLLGLEPKDWDVATDAPPKRVRELFRSTQAVGQAFGVILVRLGRSVVEVATFRAEGPYLDGRRPSQVRFTTAEEDARRRDFTINALFLDPDGDRVIDHVGGQEDLRRRILRAVGNPAERFAEDHLRLLRAVRFAARFALEIDPATADAIARDAALLKRISPERIGDELRLMLTPPTRPAAWLLLRRFRLVDVIFRFLPRQPLADPPPGRSIFLSTAPGGAIPFGLALATGCLEVLWHPPDDIRLLLQREPALRMDRAMRQALRISNDESADLVGAIEGPAALLRDDPPPVALMKRFLARPASPLSRHLLDALAAVGECAARIDSLRPQLATLAAGEVAPPPLVTGDDLVAAGLSPGPRFKSILDAVYDAQLEGRVTTRETALSLALASIS